MNKERLLKLAAHLDKVPDADFDMDTWYEEKTCGTVACALGHAALIPEFQKLGLHISGTWSTRGSPVYRGYWGVEAAELFFDLDQYTAHNLFMTDWGLDAKGAAAKIRRIVDAYKGD